MIRRTYTFFGVLVLAIFYVSLAASVAMAHRGNPVTGDAFPDVSSATLTGTSHGSTFSGQGFFKYDTANRSCNSLAKESIRIDVTSPDGSDVEYSRDISGLSAGTTYYYCAVANYPSLGGDLYGGVRSFTTPQPPADTTPPVIGSTATSSVEAGETVNINVTVTDDESAIDWIEIYVDDFSTPKTTCPSHASPSTCQWSSNSYSVGSHEYQIKTKSAGGTAISTKKSFTVRESATTTAPTVTVTHSPSSPRATDNVHIDLTASAPHTITKTIIYVDGLAKVVCTNSGSTCSDDSKYSVGTHSYYGTAENSSDGVGTSSTKEFTIGSPPVLSLDPTSGSSTRATVRDSNANGKDAEIHTNATCRGVAISSCKISGGICTTPTWSPSGTNDYYACIEKTGDTTYSADREEISNKVTFTRGGGGGGGTSSELTVTADLTVEDGVPGKPNEMGTGSLVSFFAEGDANHNACCVDRLEVFVKLGGSSRRIAWYDPYDTDEDDPGEIRNFDFYSGGEITPRQYPNRDEDDRISFTTTKRQFSQSGTYTFWAEADHSELDSEDSTNKTFIVHPSPTVVLDSKPSNPSSSPNATFTWHCTEEPCEYKYRLDGGAWTDWVTGTTATFTGLGRGTHSLEIHARNATIKAKGLATEYEWEIPLLPGEKNIFITSSRYIGWLAGNYIGGGSTDYNTGNDLHLSNTSATKPYEADLLCQQQADSAGLGWGYKALMSKANTSGSNAATSSQIFESKDRLGSCSQAIYNMHGELVANNCADLWDGTIANAVKFNENGDAASYWAWTGTLPDGSGSLGRDDDEDATCSNWTSFSWDKRGIIGDPNGVDSTWVDSGASRCRTSDSFSDRDETKKRGLYCYKDAVDKVETSIVSSPPGLTSNLTATFNVSCSRPSPACTFEYRVWPKSAMGTNTFSEWSGWTDYDVQTTTSNTITLTGYMHNGTLQPFSREKYNLEVRALAADGAEDLTWSRYEWEIGLPVNAGYVFATKDTTNGNIGGLSGADAMCQSAGQTLVSGGTFKALLSTDIVNAKDRISSCNLFNSRKEHLTDDCADLWDGDLMASIRYDEFGASAPASVWTGSLSTGMPKTTQTCQNWTSASSTPRGGSGRSSVSNSGWIDNGTNACNTAEALYCAQIITIPPLDTYIDSGPTGTTNSSAVNFTYSCNQEPCEFSYRLKRATGIWDPWSLYSTSSAKSYSGLAPGNYAFEVKAKKDSTEDATPASRTWKIGPPGIIEVKP